MSFLDKLRRQPEYIRKLILWAIIIIIGLGLLVWWIHSSYWKIKKFPKEEFIKGMNLPNLEEDKMGMPEIPEGELEELEKIGDEVKKAEEVE